MTTTVFRSTDTDYEDRDGALVEVLSAITEPDAAHDEECLPMFLIKFSDGSTIEAWAEELPEYGPAQSEEAGAR